MRHRAAAILGLVGLSEAALVGFAIVPVPLKLPMIFLNGLPLGIGLRIDLAYLEGRNKPKLLSAALCASFIVSSGVVKFVGSWLLGLVSLNTLLTMLTGLFFIAPLVTAVLLLQLTPPPDQADKELRSVRQR